MASSSSSSPIFSGSSRYASDFASVISRRVSIASLPLTQLQQQRSQMDDRATALNSLDSKLGSLQSALTALGNSFGASALQSSLSDASVLKSTISDGASEAQFSIKVTKLGSATTFVASGFPATSDPAAKTYTTQNSQSLAITSGGLTSNVSLTPADHSLQALADEINLKAGTSVRATVVNIGSSSTPNYQLSLQSVKLGAIDISLTDGATTTQNTVGQQGSAVEYSVNGADIVSDSRNVTLAPGVTAVLTGVSSGDVTLSVTKTTAQLKSAMSQFVLAFNNVVTEVDKSRGDKTAPLSGDSLLSTISNSLRQMANLSTGSGSVQALSDLGLGFDRNGKLTFDSAAFDSASAGNFDEVKAFIGTATGSGWLKSATGVLNGLEDVDSGAVKASIKTNQDAMTRQDSAISAQQDRIDKLQTDLEAQMTAADAAIAMMEQQVTYFTNMFAAMKSNQDSYK